YVAQRTDWPCMSYHVTRCNKVARRTDWPCRPCQPQQCRATRNGVPARWLHTEAACQTISTRADLAATFFLPKRVTLAIPDPAQAQQITPALSAAAAQTSLAPRRALHQAGLAPRFFPSAQANLGYSLKPRRGWRATTALLAPAF